MRKIKLSLDDIRKSVAAWLRGVQPCPICGLGEATCAGLCHPSRMCNTVTGSLIQERVRLGGESSVKDHKDGKETPVSFQWAQAATWFKVGS